MRGEAASGSWREARPRAAPQGSASRRQKSRRKDARKKGRDFTGDDDAPCSRVPASSLSRGQSPVDLYGAAPATVAAGSRNLCGFCIAWSDGRAIRKQNVRLVKEREA